MTRIPALRTPDDRFVDLPGYPYPPSYVDTLPGYDGLRTHYLDLGPRDARHTFLCLHGQPTWSYLYRKMIPVFLETGARVVAPDLLGFGRSDKPTRVEDYTFHFHRNHLLRFVEHLNLTNITLVVQDWGGILGLTLPAEPTFRRRLSRLLVMNTTIPTGTPRPPSFYRWRDRVRTTFDFDTAGYLGDVVPHLSEAEAAAYGAPFPDVRYKAGVRTFPDLMMVEPGMEGIDTAEAAEAFWTHEWSGKTFMAVGEQDDNFGVNSMLVLRRRIRGCPEPMVIEDAGHFVQEWGAPIARAALESFGDAP